MWNSFNSFTEPFNCCIPCVARWRSGRVPDLRSIGHGFKSQLPHCGVQPGQVNTRASVTKQYNLVPANGQWCLAAGKVTIGLASHWPCIKTLLVLHLRVKTWKREMSTLLRSLVEHGWLYFYISSVHRYCRVDYRKGIRPVKSWVLECWLWWFLTGSLNVL